MEIVAGTPRGANEFWLLPATAKLLIGRQYPGLRGFRTSTYEEATSHEMTSHEMTWASEPEPIVAASSAA
jgi:hypothetical protein